MFTHHMWPAYIIVNIHIHLEVFWWCPCCKAGRFEGFLDGPVAGKSVEVWIEGLESSAVHAVDSCGCWRKIHPGRLTWNIHLCKRKIIFQTTTFRFYVNLPGCMFEAMKFDRHFIAIWLMNLKEHWWELIIFRGMIPGTWHFFKLTQSMLSSFNFHISMSFMLLFMVILMEVLVSGNAQQMVKIWEERSSQLLGGSRDHGLTLLNSNCHLIYDISTCFTYPEPTQQRPSRVVLVYLHTENSRRFFFDLLTSRWRVVDLLEQLSALWPQPDLRWMDGWMGRP